MRRLFFVLAGVIFFARFANAAPLNDADLMPGKTWSAHCDFDALRAAKEGMESFIKFAQKNIDPRGVTPEEFSRILNAIDSVTVSGNGTTEIGAIIIRHHLPNAEIEAWLEKNNYAKQNEAGIDFYKISTGEKRPILFAPVNKDVAVIAINSKLLAAAKDRLNAPPAAAKKETVNPIFLVKVQEEFLEKMEEGTLFEYWGLRNGTVRAESTSDGIKIQFQMQFKDEQSAKKMAGELDELTGPFKKSVGPKNNTVTMELIIRWTEVAKNKIYI